MKVAVLIGGVIGGLVVGVVVLGGLLWYNAFGDLATWSEEEAKAKVANYIYLDAVAIWDRKIDAAVAQGGSGLRRLMGYQENPPVKLLTADWVAEYQAKGAWHVEGATIGVWFAFEDHTSPVQRGLYR